MLRFIGEDEANDLLDECHYRPGGLRPVGQPGGVSEIKNVFCGKDRTKSPDNSEAAKTAIDNDNR